MLRYCQDLKLTDQKGPRRRFVAWITRSQAVGYRRATKPQKSAILGSVCTALKSQFVRRFWRPRHMPGSLLKSRIPMRTWADHDENTPGADFDA
jgi:hypothetical protein